jgi:L-threonylcarbamoyladenylate synthase
MEIIPIDQYKPDFHLIDKAAKVLINRGVIIHPTETVYGLAGQYNEISVIQRISKIKLRMLNQPFSIMVNSLEEIFSISGHSKTPWLESFLRQFLPGPLTVLIPRKKEIEPALWNQFPELGFRYPAHLLCQELLQASSNPLITTSANRSGEPSPVQVEKIPEDLQNQVELILDGGKTIEQQPSTIIRIDTTKKKISPIREGSIPFPVLENKFIEIL